MLLVYYSGILKKRKGGLHTKEEFKLVAKKVCKKLKCPMGTKKIAGYLGATTMSIKPSELKHYKKNLR